MMAAWSVVLIFSIGAVLLFVVGLSLTLMIRGRHIDGEISTNRHMRERGITCAVHDAYASSDAARLTNDCPDLCADKTCATCASGQNS